MRAEGLLCGPDLAVLGVSPMGVTVRFKIAVGDQIRFLVRNKEINVYNGTCARVIGIDPATESPELSVEIEEARDSLRPTRFQLHDFHDNRDQVRIAPAYVATIYGVQGAAKSRTVLLKAARMTYRELYVAATRAQTSCEVVEVNPQRAFLATCDGAEDQLIHNIADELARALLRDRPKALAEDYRQLLNTPPRAETAWPLPPC